MSLRASLHPYRSTAYLQVLIKCYGTDGIFRRATLRASVDTGPNALLGQTIGYTVDKLTDAAFEAAAGKSAQTTVLMRVQVVDQLHDPFENETALLYPYVLIMKVTDS